MKNKHPHHKDELKRLNRIAGQVEGIKKMIDEHRYCPDILTQLRAVRSAVKTVEASILEAHLKSCVTDTLKHAPQKNIDAKIDELSTLLKRFDE